VPQQLPPNSSLWADRWSHPIEIGWVSTSHPTTIMHHTSTPTRLLFHLCNHWCPMADPRALSPILHCVLWTIASHTSLHCVRTIVHTQKWTTVDLIHLAFQRPPPPASQCCIPATIAYASPLTSQGLPAPKEWPKDHLVHPTSSPNTRRSQQRPMPTHRPAAFHHPMIGQWAVSHIWHHFWVIVGICISTSRPSNHHRYVPLSPPSLH